MSIAEKLQLIAENEQKVFDAGKQAEYDAFWDGFQSYGAPSSNLAYRFYKWRDGYYNPKHPFKVQGVNTVSRMFSYTDITDTKVDIDFSGSTTSSNKSAVFEYGRNLKIIRKVIVNELIPYGGWFVGCTALEEIRFEGTIANDINFADCENLTLESLRSIVDALKDCYHQEDEWTHTLTISKASKDKLDEEMASGGWDYALRYIEDKAWNLEVL